MFWYIIPIKLPSLSIHYPAAGIDFKKLISTVSFNHKNVIDILIHFKSSVLSLCIIKIFNVYSVIFYIKLVLAQSEWLALNVLKRYA